MVGRIRFRVGDILTVSCPFTEAQVSAVRPGYVSIKWPWNRVDPDTPQFAWNGEVAVTSDPAHFDWKRELFRTDPAPQHLRPGAVCRVGIPLTVVHVTDVVVCDPPRATGILPRPTLLLGVLLAGQTEVPEHEDQGCTLDPDDDVPTSIDLLFRPYDFLHLGDEVIDTNDCSWRFRGPWHWERLADGTAAMPAWPLTLTARLEGFDEADMSAVYDATESGSHSGEVARWSWLADATPFDRSSLRRDQP
ncbi:hypothetical protein [Streptomyces sp. NBC_01763]|nr:hypothetical protein [Streptomyces sp. NBC_01763]WSC41722.1 hypothetical protein OHA08_43515 [Streptomyces sp. NBC_01763]